MANKLRIYSLRYCHSTYHQCPVPPPAAVVHWTGRGCVYAGHFHNTHSSIIHHSLYVQVSVWWKYLPWNFIEGRQAWIWFDSSVGGSLSFVSGARLCSKSNNTDGRLLDGKLHHRWPRMLILTFFAIASAGVCLLLGYMFIKCSCAFVCLFTGSQSLDRQTDRKQQKKNVLNIHSARQWNKQNSANE